MATKIGNLKETGSWRGAWRVLTICQFGTLTANITGNLAVVPMNTLAFRTSVYESGGRLISRENEAGYRKLCVDELQDLGADFVHRDIEYFTDSP